MDRPFDPYHKWLGIAPKDQPPHCYRLLGIDLFESDPDVIANAADRQMLHIRAFQTGKYATLADCVLNEIASARLCLLSGERKTEYDRQLRIQLRDDPRAAPEDIPIAYELTGAPKASRWANPVPAADHGFLCPHCQEVIGYDPVLPGKTINCPGCHNLFVIPSPQAPQDRAGTRCTVEDSNEGPIVLPILGHYLLRNHAGKRQDDGSVHALVFKALFIVLTAAWLTAAPVVGFLAFSEDYGQMMEVEVEPGFVLVHNKVVSESHVFRQAVTAGIAQGLLIPTVVYAIAVILLSAVRFIVEGR